MHIAQAVQHWTKSSGGWLSQQSFCFQKCCKIIFTGMVSWENQPSKSKIFPAADEIDLILGGLARSRVGVRMYRQSFTVFQ